MRAAGLLIANAAVTQLAAKALNGEPVALRQPLVPTAAAAARTPLRQVGEADGKIFDTTGVKAVLTPCSEDAMWPPECAERSSDPEEARRYAAAPDYI